MLDARRGLPRPLCCFLLLFKIGLFTFGGGWSIVAQMQRLYVEKRKTITGEELRLIAEPMRQNEYGQYLISLLEEES